MNWNTLKYNILALAEDDYLFFPFLLGEVQTYINSNSTTNNLIDTTLKVIAEMLQDDLLTIYFVDSEKMEEINLNDPKSILSRIKEDWENTGKIIPEVNQVAWFEATGNGKKFLKDIPS